MYNIEPIGRKFTLALVSLVLMLIPSNAQPILDCGAQVDFGNKKVVSSPDILGLNCLCAQGGLKGAGFVLFAFDRMHLCCML